MILSQKEHDISNNQLAEVIVNGLLEKEPAIQKASPRSCLYQPVFSSSLNFINMDYTTFYNSLTNTAPPDNCNDYLQALWYDAKGNWDKAHTLVQDIDTKNASWIHAYLHRKEGDDWNANYWYNKAGKQMPLHTLDQEWESIVKALL